MSYDKNKFGEYIIDKIKTRFPDVKGLEYEIIPKNPGVSLIFEYGSVVSAEFCTFMSYLRFNDPIVQEALRLDKEESNAKIEINGYFWLAILAVVSLIIISILIVI